jgi:hypothetical protein
MEYVKVMIKCYVDSGSNKNNVDYENLGIERPGGETEYREGVILIDKVEAVFPATNKGEIVVNTFNDTYVVQGTVGVFLGKLRHQF